MRFNPWGPMTEPATKNPAIGGKPELMEYKDDSDRRREDY
jgi:hypothetical protein